MKKKMTKNSKKKLTLCGGCWLNPPLEADATLLSKKYFRFRNISNSSSKAFSAVAEALLAALLLGS